MKRSLLNGHLTRISEKEKEMVPTPINTLLHTSNQSTGEATMEVVGTPFGSLTPNSPDKKKSTRNAGNQATTPIPLPTARKTIFSTQRPLPLIEPMREYYNVYTPIDP